MKASRRYLIIVLFLALAIYVLVPQIGAFRSSWSLMQKAEPGWTAAAIGLIVLTYLSGALTYCFLAVKPLKYWRTVLVQFAAMFINRLLPAGIGALGANYAYLRRRHTGDQAGTIVAMNNLLGMAGHAILAVAALSVYSGGRSLVPSYGHMGASAVRGLAVAALATVVLAAFLGRRRFERHLAGIGRQLLSYRQRPWRLPAGLLSSMTLTLGNVLGLAVCAMAVGMHLPFVIIFLVFTFGIGAGTATPSPGGLGGFEAGLTAGFVAYHIPAPAALAAALLFRLVSYWLPLVFGAVALAVCQKQKLFSARY